MNGPGGSSTSGEKGFLALYDNLAFRRQFLLATDSVEELDPWRHEKICGTHLYAHPDLQVTIAEKPGIYVCMVGDLFDPTHPERGNDAVIADLLACTNEFHDVIAIVKRYAGRYAIIYRDETDFAIVHDALGLREVYYCTSANRIICGSQPNLIERFSDPRLGVTGDKRILDFYENDLKLVRTGRAWIGDETYFACVKHLMPNHYLDVNSREPKRYWPDKRLETVDLDSAITLSCNYLRGVLKAITNRHRVMMAVTSGTDSRSLLAASREVRDKIYYFINRESHLTENSSDLRIPKMMFEKQGIPFHVHHVDDPVDEGFRRVFLDNTFMSTDRILPTIYNVYYKNHQDKVNLLGVGELGREYYGKAPSNIDGYYLAYKLKYRKSQYVTTQCALWLREVRELASECRVDLMKLFLWEVLLGNWGAVGNSESDIAIEEFDPYDSHYIYELMLSADYDGGKQGIGEFFVGMFKYMWPELLEFQFNPPDTAGGRVKDWLRRVGIYAVLKDARYKWDRWKFVRSGGQVQ